MAFLNTAFVSRETNLECKHVVADREGRKKKIVAAFAAPTREKPRINFPMLLLQFKQKDQRLQSLVAAGMSETHH
ncbi:hypothetical protein DM860_010136 [Cuscuta australis]|uniref:Uncharacterized protein n=1 Tax=Cuscuta australis TaxID=267555 RepID=A0A328D648_9ASTE|nr:hypothetical protein DM860_010136 [Cuscuta australis]